MVEQENEKILRKNGLGSPILKDTAYINYRISSIDSYIYGWRRIHYR